MRLLLIDQAINDIDKIINSVNDDTCCLVFNSNQDTIETILFKIKFLNSNNRVINNQFLYTQSDLEEKIPTQIKYQTDSSTHEQNVEHCRPCDNFDMTTVHVKPENVYTALINESMMIRSTPNTSKTAYSIPSVFFQRHFDSTANVMITDLDEIYQIGVQFGEISELDIPVFSSVGIMQHSQPAPAYFKFLNTMSTDEAGILSDVEIKDPELVSWTFFINFIRTLYATYHTTIFDMMACAIYSNPGWKYVIDNIGGKITKHNATDIKMTIRASNDNTGSSALGGNWILETDSVDLTTIYFTPEIYNWKYVLATYTDNRFKFYRWNDSYASRVTTTAFDNGLSLRDKTYTVTFWYYEETFQTNCTIIDRGNYEFTIQVHNEYTIGRRGIGMATGSPVFSIIANNSIVPTGVWTHVAVVRDKSNGTRYKIYINGELTDSFTNTETENTLGASSATFTVGLQAPGYCNCNRLKSGVYLYDLCIYDTAKTQNEIRLLRNRLVQSYDAFDEFIHGPTQSANNIWQYFEVNSDRTTATLLSDWKTTVGTNDVFPNYPQWDGNRELGLYPYVQKINVSGPLTSAPSFGSKPFTGPALIAHPDNSSINVGMGFKNTTGATINVRAYVELSLLVPSMNVDGITFFLQRGLVNDPRYSNVSSSIPTKNEGTFPLSFDSIELQSNEIVYLVINRNNNYGWDFTRVVFKVTINRRTDLVFNTYMYQTSGTSPILTDTVIGRDLTIVSYDTANWKNTSIPIPNIGILIRNGYSLTTGNNSSGGTFPLTGSHFGDLTYTDFTGLNLQNVNFSGASNMNNCEFIGTTLSFTNFTGVNLTGSNFTSSNLTSSNLTSSNLFGATINASTNLSNTTLTGVQSGRISGITSLLPAGFIMI
jgi:uncharacterized protein YjbI with pentapeptide repeats